VRERERDFNACKLATVKTLSGERSAFLLRNCYLKIGTTLPKTAEKRMTKGAGEEGGRSLLRKEPL